MVSRNIILDKSFGQYGIRQYMGEISVKDFMYESEYARTSYNRTRVRDKSIHPVYNNSPMTKKAHTVLLNQVKCLTMFGRYINTHLFIRINLNTHVFGLQLDVFRCSPTAQRMD